jgi:hypothetical protein
MHERFKQRIEAALQSLERRIQKSTKPLERAAICGATIWMRDARQTR